MNKYGPYIQKLMTLVLDKEQDEFVQQMSWNELSRLKVDITEFLIKHSNDDSEKKENTEKVLLQEAEKNGNAQKKKIKK